MNQQLVDACKTGDYDKVKQIYPILCGKQKECEQLMLECGIQSTKVDNILSQMVNMKLLLTYACSNGNQEVVSFLIENGATDFVNGLHYACKNGKPHIVKYLFSIMQSQLPLPTHALRSLLTWACESGNMECVNILLNHGVGLNNNCFYYALSSKNMEMIDFCYRQTITDQLDWDYALSTACASCHVPSVKFVVEKGNTHLDFNDGLKYAAQSGNYDIVDIMLQNDATLYEKGVLGALMENHFDVALFFLQKDPQKSFQIFHKCKTSLYSFYKVLKDDALFRFCLLLDPHWYFQQHIERYCDETKLHIFEIALECGRNNIHLDQSMISYFLNRNVNLNQLDRGSLNELSVFRKRRKSKQRCVFTCISSCASHIHIIPIVKHLICSQISYEN